VAKELEGKNDQLSDLGLEPLLEESKDSYTAGFEGCKLRLVTKEIERHEESFLLEDKLVELSSDERIRQRTVWDRRGFMYGYTGKIVRESYDRSSESVHDPIQEARLMEKGEYGDNYGVKTGERQDIVKLRTREEFEDFWSWLTNPEPDTEIVIRDYYLETAEFYSR